MRVLWEDESPSRAFSGVVLAITVSIALWLLIFAVGYELVTQ